MRPSARPSGDFNGSCLARAPIGVVSHSRCFAMYLQGDDSSEKVGKLPRVSCPNPSVSPDQESERRTPMFFDKIHFKRKYGFYEVRGSTEGEPENSTKAHRDTWTPF